MEKQHCQLITNVYLIKIIIICNWQYTVYTLQWYKQNVDINDDKNNYIILNHLIVCFYSSKL